MNVINQSMANAMMLEHGINSIVVVNDSVCFKTKEAASKYAKKLSKAVYKVFNYVPEVTTLSLEVLDIDKDFFFGEHLKHFSYV